MTAIKKIEDILTQYFMCIYQGYMCINIQDMKFLWSKLSLGQLYTTMPLLMTMTDTWWTKHDCIGSLACIPNESRSTFLALLSIWKLFIYFYYRTFPSSTCLKLLTTHSKLFLWSSKHLPIFLIQQNAFYGNIYTQIENKEMYQML